MSLLSPLTLFAVASLGLVPLAAQAEDTEAGCGASIIASGSESVTVEGHAAARAGDRAGCGTIVQGSPDVFINGKPAAVHGDPTGCGGSVSSGAASVFVNGKPLAAAGDTTGCADK